MAMTERACDGVVGGLASWRDGPAKQVIAEFVARVCGGEGREPVPVEEHLAVFDNDGTLRCEKPMPIQLDVILHRLIEMAEADATLRGRQPWKAAYERDYGWLSAVMAEHYAGNETSVKVPAAGVLPAYDGISVEDFEARADEFQPPRAASSALPRVSRLRLRADGRVARCSTTHVCTLVVAQAGPGLADTASRSMGLRRRAARAVSGARSPARWTTRARPAGWAGASGVLCSSNRSGPSAGSAGSSDEASAPGLAGDDVRGRNGTAA
jgi:hypothetical protein